MPNRLKNIGNIILAWTLAGVLYSLQSFYYRSEIGQDVEFSIMLLLDVPFFLFWAFFTPLLLYLSRRFPLTETAWSQLVVLHLPVSVGVAFLHSFLYMIYRHFIIANPEVEFSWNRIYINSVANFDYGMLVYFVTLLVIGVFAYQRRVRDERARNAELQNALVQSQLSTLRSKLQPHFLFNTLNSIAVLIKDNPDAASKTVHQLSDLLRYVLKSGDEQFAILEKEIEFLRQYLAIEETRFGDRLTVNVSVDASLSQVLIPSLILQPIVENAVQHGIAQKRGDVRIDIAVNADGNRIRMQVADNGKGYNPNSKTGENGLGLSITRQRLKSLYQSDFSLQIESANGEGTNVVLEIPVIKEARA